MPTNWYLPRTIIQQAEDPSHIAWESDDDFYSIKYDDSRYTKLKVSLTHIANSYTGDRTTKTNYIFLTNFPFRFSDDVKVTGVQVLIKLEQSGRIVDDTVQLVYDQNWWGENQANLQIQNLKVYGGQGKFGIDYASANEKFRNSTFGVGIRFRSHPQWPHNASILLDQVLVRLLFEGDDEDLAFPVLTTPNLGSTRPMGLFEDSVGGPEGSKFLHPQVPDVKATGNGNPDENAVPGINSGGPPQVTPPTPGPQPPPPPPSPAPSYSYIYFPPNLTPGPNGYIGSKFSQLPNPAKAIQTVNNLPASGSMPLDDYYIVSNGYVYYWDNNQWILAFRP